MEYVATSAERLRRKRMRAREQGFCITCCNVKPLRGLRVCEVCKVAVQVRKKAQRKKLRQRGPTAIIEAHERAGDVAREHHFHAAAAQHYEDALHVPHADESAWMRLSEKLAEVLWVGNEPGAVHAVNSRLLPIYRAHPERGAEHIKTLFRVARQLSVDSRPKDRIPVLRRAIRLAELSNTPELLQQAHILMVNTLAQLDRFVEAERYLHKIERLHSKTHNVRIHIGYYIQKGLVAAGLGHEKEAFANFHRAVEIIREDTDLYRPVGLWSDYGFVALMFGRTKLAKAHLEHGLLAARRNNIAWLIPQYCLEYAELLMYMGEYTAAHEYLVEALSSDAHSAILDQMIVYIGIPLALLVKNETTLAQCVRPHVIDRAFLSSQPGRLGLVAAAFARWYVEQGKITKARTLLHRAVEAAHNAVDAWPLPLEVARCGAKADFAKARRMFTARIARPGAQVAEAYLQLFDAFVAQREGRDAHAYAREAATRFDAFQWGKYADLARSLLPIAEQSSPASRLRPVQPFSHMQAKFTEREREVATLVLKSLTNRAIAHTLGISENTVEKHVASVMDKLGVRSRHQLADAIAYPDVEKDSGIRVG